MKQSALKWLVTELFAHREPNSIEIQLVKHAQEMEKQEILDADLNAYINGSRAQSKLMYSEEEVKFIISEALQSALVNNNLELWFNIFKKK
jgi:hypothetical protein